jgi:hypothetical protein
MLSIISVSAEHESYELGSHNDKIEKNLFTKSSDETFNKAQLSRYVHMFQQTQ